MADATTEEKPEDVSMVFDLSMKKKKKKKKAAEEDGAQKPDETKEEEGPKAEPKAEPKASEEAKDEAKASEEAEDEDKAVEFAEEDEDEEARKNFQLPVDSDRDYAYQELLTRISNLLMDNNPELVKSKKSKYVMKPPQVFREGTKKTVWANFQEICRVMHRQPEHVLAYALAELGTNGSVDGNHRLVIKGRFQPKQIESVVRHYVGEYVSCRTCKSLDTNLKKENRLYFIQCKACGSSRSVAHIKTGFVAQVGKRKKAANN